MQGESFKSCTIKISILCHWNDVGLRVLQCFWTPDRSCDALFWPSIIYSTHWPALKRRECGVCDLGPWHLLLVWWSIPFQSRWGSGQGGKWRGGGVLDLQLLHGQGEGGRPNSPTGLFPRLLWMACEPQLDTKPTPALRSSASLDEGRGKGLRYKRAPAIFMVNQAV